MDTYFIEIDASEVQKCFPRFYDEQGRFFEIIHTSSLGTGEPGTDSSAQDPPIGFVGIRPLYADCELEVFIFKQYRNTLTKGIVLATLDLPEALGFKRCWMKTPLKTVVKLLSSMGKYGIIPSGLINNKHVFCREF